MREVLIIASALSIQDPRERPLDRQEVADSAHAKFRDENSDFMSYVKLWETYHAQARKVSSSRVRKWSQENFISYVKMREWIDVHQQLLALIGDGG